MPTRNGSSPSKRVEVQVFDGDGESHEIVFPKGYYPVTIHGITALVRGEPKGRNAINLTIELDNERSEALDRDLNIFWSLGKTFEMSVGRVDYHQAKAEKMSKLGNSTYYEIVAQSTWERDV